MSERERDSGRDGDGPDMLSNVSIHSMPSYVPEIVRIAARAAAAVAAAAAGPVWFCCSQKSRALNM